jgi:hypothetical protein
MNTICVALMKMNRHQILRNHTDCRTRRRRRVRPAISRLSAERLAGSEKHLADKGEHSIS